MFVGIVFSDPLENITKLGLQGGEVVADLGAGSGFYSFAIAKRLRELDTDNQGKVYAVDIQKDILDRVLVHAKEEGLENVSVVWGDIDEPGGTKLADNSCDAAIIANTFFQAEKKDQFAAEALRIVKPNGVLMVIDWSDSFGHLGPTPEMVMTEAAALPYFENAGATKLESFDAGEHHWGLLFQKR